MKENTMNLIREYQEAVATTMTQLRKYIGDDKLLHGTPGRAYPRDGHLADGSEYSFHGKGCVVTSPEDIEVDFDFGPGGRTDGFDAWRLWRFAKQFPTRYPDFQQREAVEKAIAMLIREGDVCPSGIEHDHLLYLRG